jgi:hypothetical protein
MTFTFVSPLSKVNLPELTEPTEPLNREAAKLLQPAELIKISAGLRDEFIIIAQTLAHLPF